MLLPLLKEWPKRFLWVAREASRDRGVRQNRHTVLDCACEDRLAVTPEPPPATASRPTRVVRWRGLCVWYAFHSIGRSTAGCVALSRFWQSCRHGSSMLGPHWLWDKLDRKYASGGASGWSKLVRRARRRDECELLLWAADLPPCSLPRQCARS